MHLHLINNIFRESISTKISSHHLNCVRPSFSSLFLLYFDKVFISKFFLAASISATHSQKVQVHPQDVYVMKISVNVLIIKSHTVVPPPHSFCFICLFFVHLSFFPSPDKMTPSKKFYESLKSMMTKRQGKPEKFILVASSIMM